MPPAHDWTDFVFDPSRQRIGDVYVSDLRDGMIAVRLQQLHYFMTKVAVINQKTAYVS
jgi:hypothetical protein